MPKEDNYQITKSLNEKKLREICSFFKSRNLQELELKEGDLQIILTAESDEPKISAPRVETPIPNSVKPPKSTAKDALETSSEVDGNPIVAPISGHFYASPSPEAPPYVNVGDKIKKGDKVCIIEAMKVMNEITSPFSGTVSEILVENGKAVQQGNNIIIIK